MTPPFNPNVFQYTVHLSAGRYDVGVTFWWPLSAAEAAAGGVAAGDNDDSAGGHQAACDVRYAELNNPESRVPQLPNGSSVRTACLPPQGTFGVTLLGHGAKHDRKAAHYSIAFTRDMLPPEGCTHPVSYERSEDFFGSASGTSQASLSRNKCFLCDYDLLLHRKKLGNIVVCAASGWVNVGNDMIDGPFTIRYMLFVGLASVVLAIEQHRH
jgi:hypothetical protein